MLTIINKLFNIWDGKSRLNRFMAYKRKIFSKNKLFLRSLLGITEFLKLEMKRKESDEKWGKETDYRINEDL